MMDFDLRANKLQKQSDARIFEAKKKRERELALQNEQRLREEKLRKEREEIARLTAEHEQIEYERKLEEEQFLFQKSGGILFEIHNLIPYQIEGEDDKVILPESCISILDGKNAFYNGPLHFEISCSLKPHIITHCGMREFSAQEGTVGLPTKVIHSLFQNEHTTVNDIGTINISYRKLHKIKSTKFAPHSDQFFSLYQHNIKHVLEQNLKLHTCLTVGDILNVWFRGKSFHVTVVEILPERYGSLIDTDVEIDFVNLETATTKTTSSSFTIITPHAASSSSSLSSTLPQDNSGVSTTSNISSNIINQAIYHKLSDTTSNITAALNVAIVDDSMNVSTDETNILLPEPQPDEIDTILFRFRLVDGTTTSRRFSKSQKLVDIFYYVSQYMKINKNSLQLSSSSVNRTYTVKDEAIESLTLENVGFSKRELLVASVLPHS